MTILGCAPYKTLSTVAIMTTTTLATLCGGAFAQVAVPPGPAVPETPKWTPPPPPPPPPAPGEPGSPPVQALPAEEPLPEKEWANYLAARDAEGKLPALKWPRYWAAIKANDLIPAEKQQELEPFFQERREVYEQIAIDNADILARIDGGMITSLKANDRDSLGSTTKSIKPIAGKSTALSALRENRLLSSLQLRSTEKIFDARKKAEVEDMRKNADGKEAQAAAMTVHMLLLASEESMWARRWMLIESTQRMSQVLDRAGISGASLDAAKKAEAAIAAAKDDDAKYDAVFAVFKTLDADKQREFLKAVVSTRPGTGQ
jgi:hypothetical protein